MTPEATEELSYVGININAFGFFCFSVGIFLCLVLFLFAVMTWLVIYPGEFLTETLKLYNFRDMEFKFLLVALAALNFFLCFVIEVSQDVLFSHAYVL